MKGNMVRKHPAARADPHQECYEHIVWKTGKKLKAIQRAHQIVQRKKMQREVVSRQEKHLPILTLKASAISPHRAWRKMSRS